MAASQPGQEAREPTSPDARLAARHASARGGPFLTSSTPDALWASGAAKFLQPAAVVCDGLSRSVGGVRLLDRVDLSIDVGARVLVLARPAASASLLLRILAGLALPGSGTFRVAGLARADDSAQGWVRRVGYVGPLAGIYPWMSPSEALDLAGRLAGLEGEDRLRRAADLVEQFEISAPLDAPIRRGGPGLAQLTALACTMMADPEVILLDRPLLAFEPRDRARLLALSGPRRTVLMTGIAPDVVGHFISEVVAIRSGRIIAANNGER